MEVIIKSAHGCTFGDLLYSNVPAGIINQHWQQLAQATVGLTLTKRPVPSMAQNVCSGWFLLLPSASSSSFRGTVRSQRKALIKTQTLQKHTSKHIYANTHAPEHFEKKQTNKHADPQQVGSGLYQKPSPVSAGAGYKVPMSNLKKKYWYLLWYSCRGPTQTSSHSVVVCLFNYYHTVTV